LDVDAGAGGAERGSGGFDAGAGGAGSGGGGRNADLGGIDGMGGGFGGGKRDATGATGGGAETTCGKGGRATEGLIEGAGLNTDASRAIAEALASCPSCSMSCAACISQRAASPISPRVSKARAVRRAMSTWSESVVAGKGERHVSVDQPLVIGVARIRSHCWRAAFTHDRSFVVASRGESPLLVPNCMAMRENGKSKTIANKASGRSHRET
jgi:hypothetical protein